VSYKQFRFCRPAASRRITGETRTVATNQFRHFRFGNIQAGQAYTITITHKRYKFSGTRTVTFFVENVAAIFETREWACIRQENLGVSQRSRIKVERCGAVLWEYPVRKELPSRSLLDNLPTIN